MTETDEYAEQQPEETLAGSKKGLGCAILFFGVFALLGGGFGVKMTIDVLHEYQVPREWAAAECRIVSSSIERHHSTDSDGHSSTTYSPEFTFTYEHSGQSYSETGYKRSQMSSSHKWASSITSRYRSGETYSCWVNPDDPTEAVLEHGVTWRYWLLFLVPIIFTGIGLGGIFFAITAKPEDIAKRQREGEARSRRESSGKSAPRIRTRPGERLRFRIVPKQTASGTVVGLLIFNLIWNGVLAAMTIHLLKSGLWPVLIFLSIFWLIGLLVVGVWFYSLIYWLLVGDPRVETGRDRLAPGEESSLLIEHPRGFSVNNFEVKLVCNKYSLPADRDGDDRPRRKGGKKKGPKIRPDTIHEEILVSREPSGGRPLRHVSVNTEFRIPEDAQPTAQDENGWTSWAIRVHMDIPNRPDVNLDFPIRVVSPPVS